MPAIFKFIPHPRIAARQRSGPPKTIDVVVPTPDAPWYKRLNAALAVKITGAVGTMWCAYAFAALALVSLPAAADHRAEATYQDADAVLHTSLDIQRHLEAQDVEIERILAAVRSLGTA